MNVTYRCPDCDRSVRFAFGEHATSLKCPDCAAERRVGENALVGGRVARCLVCGCRELFVRKDFSQKLGIAIIATGFAASTVAWYFERPLWTYAILFLTALVDVVLYLTVGNLLQCYRCHGEYRDSEGLDEHVDFSLETHERFRRQAAAMREGSKVEAK